MLRVTLLVTMIVGVAYVAWFSPLARPIHSLTVEAAQPAAASP